MWLTPDDTGFRRPRVHRLAARYAIAVVSVTMWSGVPIAVQAQSNPVPQTNGQGPLRAPIGHRQPSARDLPPDVLQHEGMIPRASEPAPSTQSNSGDPGSSPTGPFEGGDLRICRQC